ncbi:MAG TPA: vanadium-dependent haloperoxidase [Thermoanaerobaculia bacterium]|nr:vanadium-dependent haloperoxidase [Thermoanaerobaculia bacterium]
MSDLSKLPQAAKACLPPGVTDQHGKDAFEVRFGTATFEATKTGSVQHTTNGDEELYPDKSGTYTKCLKQDKPGVVNPKAFKKFRVALGSADGKTLGTADFEVSGLLGAGRKLNGPLGAFALTLDGADSQHFGDAVVPPAPKLASPEYATELVELYWASLLRDVPFTEYATNATAIAAAKELTQLGATYAGPKNGKVVTPGLLFRGGLTLPHKKGKPTTYFAGETVGPYISQLCIRPTHLGAQPIDQIVDTLAAGVDYLTDLKAWAAVQNGASLPPPLPDRRRYLHDGRGLGSYTHGDELYQAYLVAYLVLNTLGIGANLDSPYNKFKNQQGFGTFGGPDIVATLGAVARAAINSVWYQKWIVHLRHRPESGGGIVELIQTGQGNTIDGKVNPIVLTSQALQQSHVKNGSYLLSQAFPEGSPAHPAYPTGHGTVAGACITVLKFFFNGEAKIPNPMVPSADGLSLVPYTGGDSGKLTVNGELHKLAHNISFGHGIHAGIHWRSDTDYSLLLGEAVALTFLQDQAWTYKENFAVELTKMDGNKVTIKNH